MNFLNKPYPYNDSVKEKLIISISFGLFIALFLVFFKPFTLENLEHQHKTLFIIGFGVVTFFALLINYFILPILFPRFFIPENWTTGKEIIVHFILNIFLIAVLNIIYSVLFCENCEPFYQDFFNVFVFSFLSVFLTGIIPVSFFVLISQNIRMKNNIKNAEMISKKIHVNEFNIRKVRFSSSSKNMILSIDLSRLIMIEASGNYVTVFYVQDKLLKKELIRNTLKNIEKELAIKYTELERCHKSYIVNISKIKKIKGNAQGYKLEFSELDFKIPVSRSFSKRFIQKLEKCF